MYRGNAHHYLTVGSSALNTLQAALQIAGITAVKSILDFGAGAGRVTRWLHAAWPDAAITVADIRQVDLDFCASEFAAATWNPGIDLERIAAPGSYDLIWVGSVMTHLSAATSRRLLQSVYEWTNKSGLAALSFHGRYAYASREKHYINKEALPHTGSAAPRHSARRRSLDREDGRRRSTCCSGPRSGTAGQIPEGGPEFISTTGPKFIVTAIRSHSLDRPRVAFPGGREPEAAAADRPRSLARCAGNLACPRGIVQRARGARLSASSG